MSKKIHFLLFFFLCLASIPLVAQNIEVKGVVTEATTNEPLPGVTVKVKGKDTGTVTNMDGKYTVKANKGDILVFSTIGMKSIEHTISSNAPINVSMEEDNVALEQVVVIGYGTAKKSHLSGAVSSVGAKELNGAVATNAGTALQGKIAGVSVTSTSGDPNEGMTINVRGISSLSSNDPLYVIDGSFGDLSMVDPSDIASIEVLKDAAAAAIYGSRAAGGVVLVTTKSGRKDMPTKLEVNFFTGFSQTPKKLKVFNGEEKAIEEFDKANGVLYESAWKSQFLSGMMMPIMQFVGNLGYVGVSILGGYLAIKKTIGVGDIQAFIQYVKTFTQPIAQVAQVANMLQSTAAASERVFEFLEEEEEDQFVENPVHIDGLEGSVEFKDVHFGYNPDKIIINDFTAKVKPGQKVAIVGPTGAGKTTMIKLLMRFYDVNSGAILLDGSNIKELDRGELRRVFGMVLQDTWLFGGTVKENIKYGKEDATDTEVIEAAKAAHVHHFIKTLPKGYDALIDEESSNISAGQKQLLTIARVILTNPKILILDEATSSIDTRTEQQIQTAMDNLMKGRTSFIIAHRLSTIKNADLILVMEHGDIVEQGTHSELLEKNGAYARLYNSQFDLEE